MSSAQTTDDLFNSTTLQRLDLELHSADWAKLKENFQTNTFYPADMIWNGQTVRNVGIRSRGRGSRNANKPGLKIDFDKYSANQKFLGLKSLVLDNLTQDPSGIHETVAMASMRGSAFLRRAKRTSGCTCGANTSASTRSSRRSTRICWRASMDRSARHPERRLALRIRVAGRLALHRSGHRPGAEQTALRSHDARIGNRREEVSQGAGADDARQPDARDRFVEVLGPRFDLPGFVRFVAVQAFLGDTDGFLGSQGMNNFYLYRLENQDQHVLIVWIPTTRSGARRSRSGRTTPTS